MDAVDPVGLERVAADVRSCMRCPLSATRRFAVPGEGAGSMRGMAAGFAGIMLVGEAPGRNEDETGRPFCGSAGKNLDLALAAAGINRDEVFVTSIVKCRPPENRDPTPEEKAACRPYLLAQVDALRPRVVVALGRHGLSGLLGAAPADFASLPGTFLEGPAGVPIWVSLHPAAVIYRQKWKAQYLADWTAFGAWIHSGAPVPATRRVAGAPQE